MLYIIVMLKGRARGWVDIDINAEIFFLKLILIYWYILFFLKFLNWSCVCTSNTHSCEPIYVLEFQ